MLFPFELARVRVLALVPAGQTTHPKLVFWQKIIQKNLIIVIFSQWIKRQFFYSYCLSLLNAY
jgi:hypothetical protein